MQRLDEEYNQKRLQLQESHSRKKGRGVPFQDVTNMLPHLQQITDRPPMTTFVEGYEVPPCCALPNQQIHPSLSRYVDVPSRFGHMTYSALMEILRDETKTMNLLGTTGCMAPFQTCENCGHKMKREYSPINKWRWVCNRRQGGNACKRAFSVKRGTFFENGKLSLAQNVLLIWHFVHHLSQEQCRQFVDFGQNKKTVTNHYSSCREVCTKWIHKNWEPIGGKGHVVEIDESYFAGQQKYGKGKPTTWKFPWVFGCHLRHSHLVWLQRVPERDRDTLVPIIEERVAKCTTIYSDCWAAYKNLQQYFECEEHFTVNHKRHYVDPTTGAHTQTIEGSWKHCKNFLPSLGLKEDQLNGYLGQFMWDRWAKEYHKDPFIFFLECLPEIYPPFRSQYNGVREV